MTVTEIGGTPAIGAFAGPIARSSVARVGAATALTAVCGYAVVYLAARDLAPAGFSLFAVFWGAFGLVTGAANGLLQETTREVRAAGYAEMVPGRRTHPLRVAGMVGIGAAVVIAGSSPLWSGRVFATPTGCRWACSASGWRDSACTPRCWACWPAPTAGPSTGR